MRILIWGLGYVGTVSAACIARSGHEVIGVELNRTKVELLNAGQSAVKEPGLDDLVSQMVAAGRLKATQDGAAEVSRADLSLICVGTPSAADGSQILDYVRNVAIEIGKALRHSSAYHVVVMRSTVFPGTTGNLVAPLLQENSGRQAERDFGLVVNPEFLRETTAIPDFRSPPYTIIGESDSRSGDLVARLYEEIAAPTYRVAYEEAELLKFANNAYHALKIGFANEIGRMSERLGVDSQTIMRLVCADTKLNISDAYLKPGFAFGGSCLPKDLRALTTNARRLGEELPILESVLPSNRLQIEKARQKIHAMGAGRVAVLGLSFKPGTDDLRESPIIELIHHLWRDGVDVLVHDPDVHPETMLGSNRKYLERQLPQINQILCSRLEDAVKDVELVVVSQRREEFILAIQSLDSGIAVLELEHLNSRPSNLAVPNYQLVPL